MIFKFNKIVFIEGNIFEADTKWSKLINNMDKRKFDLYCDYLRLNYLQTLTSTMIKKLPSVKLKKLFESGYRFEKEALRYMSKLGFSRSRNLLIFREIKNIKENFVYILGSRDEMKETINFLKSNRINYIVMNDCGHYSMIEKPKELSLIVKSLKK